MLFFHAVIKKKINFWPTKKKSNSIPDLKESRCSIEVPVFTVHQIFLLFFNRMTPKVLTDICKKHKLYRTPHLNDVLYLHYKGMVTY